MSRIQETAANFTSTAVVSPWLRCDYYEPPFNLSVLVSLDSGAALTLSLAYILDDLSNGASHQVLVSQATTTITVVDNGPLLPGSANALGHGLATGDVVVLDGLYNNTIFTVTVTNATTYTVTAPTSNTVPAQIFSARTGRVVIAGSAGDKIIGASGAGIAARTALPVNAPIYAIQLTATATTTPGVARLTTMQGGTHS